MGEVVNLNKRRKAEQKAAAQTQAAANRVRFGLTKDQRAKGRQDADKTDRELDNKKLD
jgi:Domain of unknown function (DUF4169)